MESTGVGDKLNTPPFDNDRGVPPNDVPNQWFFMRCAYGKEQIAREFLQNEGIECFLPTQDVQRLQRERKLDPETHRTAVDPKTREPIYIKRRRHRVESLIPNSIFVHSTRQVLARYIGQYPLTFFHHFYCKDIGEDGRPAGTGRKPIIVPDSQMEQFRIWAEANARDKYYRSQNYTFQKGEMVRVLNGNFEGFIGQVVRIKGQKRIGINIQGVGFIATSYIPPDRLEKISDPVER